MPEQDSRLMTAFKQGLTITELRRLIIFKYHDPLICAGWEKEEIARLFFLKWRNVMYDLEWEV